MPVDLLAGLWQRGRVANRLTARLLRFSLLADDDPDIYPHGIDMRRPVVLPNGSVMDGTSQGIFRWTPSRSDREKRFGRSGRTRVSSLAVDGKGRVIAGTTHAGVFVSEEGGDTWFAANAGLPTLRIRALAVAADGDVYAAVGPADWEVYATGRDTNAGVRGIFRERFSTPGR